MRLLTAHLENFRSTEELDLDFRADGVHALVGPPGSGKSSVFAGLVFAMYGDPGPDQEMLDLRYDRAEPKSLVVADYTWSHEGTTYRTRRSLRRAKRGGQDKEISSAQMWRDGVEIDNMTPTLMTAEVTKVLGMGERGLTGSSLIRQGEVAILTTAPPTEVQKLVEEHTGVNKLTKARDNARKASNDARKISDALPGSLPDVADAKDAAEQATLDAEELQKVADMARAKSDRAVSNWRDAHTIATDLQQRAITAQSSREAVVAARAGVTAATNSVDAAAAGLAEVGLTPSTSLEDVNAQLRDLDSQRSTIADLGNALLAACRTAEGAHRDAQAASDSAAAAETARPALVEQVTDLTGQYEEVVADGQQARAAQTAATNEVARLAKSLEALASAAAHCPTCQQELADTAGLIDDLTGQQKAAAARAAAQGRIIDDLTGQARALNTRIKQLRTDLDQTDRVIAAASGASDRDRQAHAHLAEQLTAAAACVDNADGTIDDVLTGLREAKASIDARLTTAGEQRAAIRAVHAASEQLRKATATLETATVAVVDAPDPEVVAEALSEAGRLRGTADSLTAETASATTAAQAAQMGASQLRSAADVAANQWARKQKAVQDAEVLATVSQVLGAYREDLIGDFCAGISAAATELLARFGGEHVAFRLESDFVPRVELADGRLRKTSALSGGEKARVGLAFRLGISMQITEGGLPSQLVGDEITSYLDEDGRRGVLEVIRELFSSPILVSHTNEILDHAAQVHQLWRSPLGTTQTVDVDLAS
ncbi:AAA family ATPase [Gordonia sihwensis]|uniref:AAA family ATPase n=1 Tax=Gordonia sihwensis TaxID=173559 RepID=UPI000A8B682A|nr:SMC family ATPase [Gordonia sihwensis]